LKLLLIKIDNTSMSPPHSGVSLSLGLPHAHAHVIAATASAASARVAAGLVREEDARTRGSGLQMAGVEQRRISQ